MVVEHNRRVRGGEIDLVAFDHGEQVVVEVCSVSGPGDPLDAVDHAKRRHVSKLGGSARVDFIGVGVRDWGVEIHWLPG